MTTRYLKKSQVGFHFTLGSPYSEDGDYENDWRYFQQCSPAIQAALRALPCWTQTVMQAADPLEIAPYAVCDFDIEMECINNEMTCSFWVESERIALFPKADVLAMRDAIGSAMTARFVKAQTYLEYSESGFADLEI